MYKELFRSTGSVVLVDCNSVERLCHVQVESRNDQRQQYTLRVSHGQRCLLWGGRARAL